MAHLSQIYGRLNEALDECKDVQKRAMLHQEQSQNIEDYKNCIAEINKCYHTEIENQEQELFNKDNCFKDLESLAKQLCTFNDTLAANNKVLAEQFEASEDNSSSLRKALEDNSSDKGVARSLNSINEQQMEKIHRLQSENESMRRNANTLGNQWQEKEKENAILSQRLLELEKEVDQQEVRKIDYSKLQNEHTHLQNHSSA